MVQFWKLMFNYNHSVFFLFFLRGLNLLLRITDQDVLNLIRKEDGARIVIHDPYQLPFVSEYGINVKPSDMTAVSVSMSTMNRLPAPWGNCSDESSNENNKDEPYSILVIRFQLLMIFLLSEFSYFIY